MSKNRYAIGTVQGYVSFPAFDEGGEIEVDALAMVHYIYPLDVEPFTENFKTSCYVFLEDTWRHVTSKDLQVWGAFERLRHVARNIAATSIVAREHQTLVEMTPAEERMLLPLHGE